MKARIFMSTIVIAVLTISLQGSAQIPLDTVKIGDRIFEYQNEEYKRLPDLRAVMLQAPIDPQVETYWNQYNTTHNIALGMEIGGVGLMGYGLIRSLQGKESGTYTIAGASLALTGVLFDLLVAKPHAIRALNTHNDLVMGRSIADFDALPVEPKEEIGTTADGRSAYPQVRNSNSSPRGDNFIGFTVGTGWSRQMINYAYVLDERLISARVSSFGFQLGKSRIGQMGWQVGLSMSQHGNRLEASSNSNGVQILAKVDERYRYLEVPFNLNYPVALGNSPFEFIPTAGLSFGYALSGLYWSNGSGNTETRTVDIKVVDKVSLKGVNFGDRLDMAFNFGCQVPYKLGPGKVVLEGRYHFGILNLDRNSEIQITESGDKVFNRSIFVGIGYRLHL